MDLTFLFLISDIYGWDGHAKINNWLFGRAEESHRGLFDQSAAYK